MWINEHVVHLELSLEVLCQLYLIKTGKKFTKTTTKPHAVQVKVKEDKGTISGAELCRDPRGEAVWITALL